MASHCRCVAFFALLFFGHSRRYDYFLQSAASFEAIAEDSVDFEAAAGDFVGLDDAAAGDFVDLEKLPRLAVSFAWGSGF